MNLTDMTHSHGPWLSTSCQIHLRALSSGAIHPLLLARGSLPYHLPGTSNEHWGYDIQINGDHVGILFLLHEPVAAFEDAAAPELVVWNWKTWDMEMVRI